jgi:hypothetical protein
MKIITSATLGAATTAAVVAVTRAPRVRRAVNAVRTETRNRTAVAGAALRGRPVMYRMHVNDGTLDLTDAPGLVMDSRVTMGPPRAELTDVRAVLEDAIRQLGDGASGRYAVKVAGPAKGATFIRTHLQGYQMNATVEDVPAEGFRL